MWAWYLAVYALAVAVRVTYVLVADPTIRPISDGRNYHLLATNLAEGRGYIAPFDWAFLRDERPTAEFMPLHPVLLATATILGFGSVLGHQLWLAAVGAATAVLTTVLGLRVTGDRRIAVLAGGVAAVHPLLFGSDGALMPETLFTLLLTAAVVCLLDGRPGWTFTAGILAGAAVLTRGDGLLWLPVVAAPVLLLRHRRDLRPLLVRGGLLALGVLLVVTPWVARNAARFDGELVLSTNLGSLLNGANCPPAYEGPDIGSWVFTCADRVRTDRADEVGSSARLRRAGLDHIGANLDRLPVVAGARVARAWGVLHPTDQARAEAREGRVAGTQLAGVVLDWLLLPLFVGGLVLLRRRDREVVALVAPVLLGLVVVVVAYGNTRFREVGEPALVVGAAAAVVLTAGRRTPLTEQR